ncbi:hypothetical protein [Marinomonas sp. THO17]|uniref:hypothetical protein n=1 Tax=Marinomonas sp. THO17 TaxID=3149048 RepID=UPI00336C200E
MKRFKNFLFLSIFFSGSLLGSVNDWDIVIGKLTPLESSKLINQSSMANPDYYSSVHVRYFDKKNQFFIHTDNPTIVKYKKALNCDGIDYPTIMLQTDASHEKASLSTKFIINRLYIFDELLKLLKRYESTYRAEEDDSGFYIDEQHIFTLDNVEKFACDRIKELK